MTSTKKDFKYFLPMILGIFIIVGAITFAVLGGGAWFYDMSDNSVRLDLKRVFGGAFYLIYYTIQTNLFLGTMLVIYTFKRNSIKVNSILYSSVMLITITFILYWTAVAPFNTPYIWGNIYLNFDSIVTHIVNPMIGFIFIILNRKHIKIEKRTVGFCSLYISFFLIMNAVLWGAGARYTQNGKYANGIKGVSVYGFTDLQHILFINFEDQPGLCWLINMLLIVLAPLIVIAISWCWQKATKISSTNKSYYKWMDRIKGKRENNNY